MSNGEGPRTASDLTEGGGKRDLRVKCGANSVLGTAGVGYAAEVRDQKGRPAAKTGEEEGGKNRNTRLRGRCSPEKASWRVEMRAHPPQWGPAAASPKRPGWRATSSQRILLSRPSARRLLGRYP